ncbi:MAG TPA: HAMP domain-containing protein [Polyangiaceae bacterium]|nr:HAMP domain-containing protein [Polyangiaceae bacterium]
MSGAATVSVPPTGRHQRRMKNYLLDRHFQLKYSGYLVGIALLFSICLGALLWRTSQAVIAQSNKTVEQGGELVKHGQEVVEESRKVSEVVKMNIVKDPIYSDNPGLLEAFKGDADKQDERLKSQQAELEKQAAALKEQSAAIQGQQTSMFITLTTALTLLVVLIGFAGIMVTHRVAGPIFKMKRQIREVGEGHLRIPNKLRKGDELVDFFEAFETMVINLRSRQQGEIDKLDQAIKTLEPKAEPGELDPLYQLRQEMTDALNT